MTLIMQTPLIINMAYFLENPLLEQIEMKGSDAFSDESERDQPSVI